MSASAVSMKAAIPVHPHSKLILNQAIGHLPDILDIDSLTKENLKKFSLTTDSLQFTDVLATLIYHDKGISGLKAFIVDSTYSYVSRGAFVQTEETKVRIVQVSKKDDKFTVC